LGPLLEENGLEPCEGEGAQLLLKRSFSANGANRQFVNGSPCTLAQLKEIGDLLVDMHGPHEHQSLLRNEGQILVLDNYCKLGDARREFQNVLSELRALEEKKIELGLDEKQFQQQLDLLQFQVNEIKSAGLRADEEEQVQADYQVAFHARKILDLGRRAFDLIGESDEAVLPRLAEAQKSLEALAAIDPKASNLADTNRSVVIELQDLASSLRAYLERIEVDPGRLEELNQRLSTIQTLKRKYGRTLAEVIAFGEESDAKLERLKGRDAELAKLDAQKAALEKKLGDVGGKLRKARQQRLPELAKGIAAQLRELGFAQAGFTGERVEHEPYRFGLDQVSFRFAPNPGEPAKELKAIASSGEISRVMLAVKTALAAEDEIPVLVFDEIDANVGGEIAGRVGEKMAFIGSRRQVLCITHLPQVAARASRHFQVFKEVRDGRTYSGLRELEGKARVEEIARMLGGSSESSVKYAKELLRR
ncbi:MAG: DNA repair protein RecN, partial [Verrucomicrobiae bacterium]|nr:DNA repair protein RecN [Verrucomicrobiae bacterium]